MLGRGLTRRSAVGDGLQPTRAVVAVHLVRQHGGQCLVNAFLDRQTRPRQKQSWQSCSDRCDRSIRILRIEAPRPSKPLQPHVWWPRDGHCHYLKNLRSKLACFSEFSEVSGFWLVRRSDLTGYLLTSRQMSHSFCSSVHTLCMNPSCVPPQC